MTGASLRFELREALRRGWAQLRAHPLHVLIGVLLATIDIPGSGGIFDVKSDGELVYSKFETGRFPQPGEVAGILSRSDILDAHRERLREAQVPTVELHLGHHHDKAASA